MKRIIELILASILIGCFAFMNSCDEAFLEKSPPGSAAGTVMVTSNGVEGLLIGAYSMLNGRGNSMSSCIGTEWTWGNVTSDDAIKGSDPGAPSELHQIQRYEANESNPFLRDRWKDCYDGVARANDVLVFLNEAKKKGIFSEDRQKEIEGEAHFLRAWYHFKARKIWERIPYIKTVEEMGGMQPEEIKNDREVWDDIEADLQVAIDNLPETKPLGDPGRADKFASMAVKAYVHLFQNEFPQAKTLLDDIINKGGYQLVDFSDNYGLKKETENNAESVFELQISVAADDNDYGVYNNYLDCAGAVWFWTGPAGGGWQYLAPTYDLFLAYQTTEDGLPVLEKEDRALLEIDKDIDSDEEFIPTQHPLDPRVDHTIARRGIDYLGYGINAGQSWLDARHTAGCFMSKKYMHHKNEKTTQYTSRGGMRNSKNFRVIRYSHVLLWRAECAVEDNQLDMARQLVNQIRVRAKNSRYVMGRCTRYVLDQQPAESEINWNEPAANYVIEPYPSGADAFSTQEKARKAVRLEQRLEFATEGMRFFDLRRWGIANEVLNEWIQFNSYMTPTEMQGASFDPEKDDYWPLPIDQVDLQMGVLEQDPAYK